MLFSRKIILFWAFLGLFFAACMPQNRLSRQNINSIYSKSSTQLKPNYRVYHFSVDSSQVFFSIKPTKLLYANGDAGFKARVKIKYKLFNNVDDLLPTDTASFNYTFAELADTNKYITGSFKMKTSKGKLYVAEIIFSDINRKQHNTSLVEVDKISAETGQNYLLLSYPDSTPIYTSYLEKDKVFTIMCNDKYYTTLYVKYYFKEIPPPPPPFADKQGLTIPIPDTVFTLPLINGQTVPQQFSTAGLYVVCSDTADKEGLAILRPDGSFPEFTRPIDILRPLRYLLPQRDYDRMLAAPDIKKEVDEFWLRAADSQSRAREVLKNYYTGARLANSFFTTTREGWKTDRGMVYIIFGQPLSSYSTGNTETWVYSNGTGAYAPTFIFERKADGIAGYDYFLRRSESFKPSWYEMVENWRNGRLLYWY